MIVEVSHPCFRGTNLTNSRRMGYNSVAIIYLNCKWKIRDYRGGLWRREVEDRKSPGGWIKKNFETENNAYLAYSSLHLEWKWVDLGFTVDACGSDVSMRGEILGGVTSILFSSKRDGYGYYRSGCTRIWKVSVVKKPRV